MVASNSPECNILIIDDEPAARCVVAGLFRAENCITYEAQNGVEGLRMAREIKPQLVLLISICRVCPGTTCSIHSKPTRRCTGYPWLWLPRQASPTSNDAILSAKPAPSSIKALFHGSICTGCWTWCCDKSPGGRMEERTDGVNKLE